MATGDEKSIDASVSVRLMRESFRYLCGHKKIATFGNQASPQRSKNLAQAVPSGFRYPVFPDLVNELASDGSRRFSNVVGISEARSPWLES